MMGNIIRRALCFLLGFHDWKYDRETCVMCNRICMVCGRKEHSNYDPAYGGTYWTKGWCWSKNDE
jgi:hypothetical protein